METLYNVLITVFTVIVFGLMLLGGILDLVMLSKGDYYRRVNIRKIVFTLILMVVVIVTALWFWSTMIELNSQEFNPQ